MAKVSISLRKFVRERASSHCEYCLCPAQVVPDSFQIDHIIPVVLSGETVAENLAYSCGGCNGYKHKRTDALDPLTNQIVPLFHPRRHEWHEHFQWSGDGLSILGISPIGRATVVLLQINRLANINLRRMLIMIGQHPPAI